jgi:uncharacterized membrane protein YfcA
LELNQEEFLLSGLELLIALFTVFVGATVMGTVSFGLGLVVAPVLLLFIAPQSVVVIVNAIIAILLALVLVQVRHHLNLRQVWGMTLGGLAAVPIGALALNSANPVVLRITIAIVILLLGILSLFNIQIPMARQTGAGPVFGFLASLSVTTLSIGGPLAAIYVIAQQWRREQMRASLAFYFLLCDILALALYSVVGLVDLDTLANIGLLVPALLLGFGLASLIVPRINEGVFRYVAVAVIIMGSLMLLVREATLL